MSQKSVGKSSERSTSAPSVLYLTHIKAAYIKRELLQFSRSAEQDLGWGREEGMTRRIVEEQCGWVQGASHRVEKGQQRVRQGHGKGGGWNIGHDRYECAGLRSGLRTPRKEEQVEVRSKGMSRAIGGQISAGRRAEGRTRQSAGRVGQTQHMVYG